jgi:class 3 adenylate cyclase/predicted transcriptional regulator YheO
MQDIILIFLIMLTALFFFMAGIGFQRYRGKKGIPGKRIEEYPFYPFIKNKQGHIEFSPDLFNRGIQHFLSKKDPKAARQLIIIGEQNFVRDILGSDEIHKYKELYRRHDGNSIINDNNQYLENYKRIVKLIGKSFPGTGIEILLHNLVNPSKSIIAIENGEVTGRQIENGTTNLVLDLKTRKENNQDKLNYELNIGSRKFKCTTIPIFRPDFGLVGAICINVDANFIGEDVAKNHAKLVVFLNNFLKTDFKLDENILSKEEYRKAISGKKHFLDDPILRIPQKEEERGLEAIMFSDIAGFTSLMGSNEGKALVILGNNRVAHLQHIHEHKGVLLKEMGDGILASFKSVSGAVRCALALQKEINEKETYKIRIGIHLGEVFKSNNDILGDGVNIASRIQSQAPPGSVVVSEVVFQNIRNKLDVVPEFFGKKELKNVDGEVRLYKFDPFVDYRTKTE